jgi:hypothetical protein
MATIMNATEQARVARYLTLLACLARHLGMERIVDIGDLPPLPQLLDQLAREDFDGIGPAMFGGGES